MLGPRRHGIGGMEVDGEAIEQGLGGLLKAFEIVPPPVAGELVFEVAPEALNEIEFRRIGGQKERLDALGVRLPGGFSPSFCQPMRHS